MNNLKALKNIPFVILLLLVVGMTSCVSRVSIPDDEKQMFVIDLQMLYGSDDIFATVHTSNNLNGSYPIDKPEEVIIQVNELEVDNFIEFVYNPDRGVYEYTASESILTPNTRLRLTAEIKGSDIPKIRSYTKVPLSNKLVDTELVFYENVLGEDGKEYWQGTIRFNFEDLNRKEALFYQLALKEKLQTKSIESGEPIYTTLSPDENLLEIININSGQFAVKEFINKEGLWIDLDKLGDDEYFEIVVRSGFPLEHANQSSDNIFGNVLSITEDHYNYHLGLNNIESSNVTLFNEKGLYRSNIEKGLGIFSTCVSNPININLTQ